MKKIVNKSKLFALRVLGKFPQRLPDTWNGLEKFSDSIFYIYNLPNLPSYHHAIATMIMHLDPLTITAPKSYFAKSIRKAMINQVAFDKIQSIKAAQKEKEDSIAKDAKDAQALQKQGV